MFTGLIQSLGTLQYLGTDQLQITCEPQTAHLIVPTLAIGDSVAVDGVCLTVVEILSQGFVAAVSPETLDRTTLGKAQRSTSAVNLETSLQVGSKLGGHFVTGHVDGLGALEAAVQTAKSWELSFTVLSPAIARYVVFKGSIAINGVSLTVADCNPAGTWFKVAVIPHTFAATNLKDLHPGSLVNLEGDILGKYVEKFLRGDRGIDHPHPTAETPPVISPEGITPAFLTEHGYL